MRPRGPSSRGGPAALARALDERLRLHDAAGAASLALPDDPVAVAGIVGLLTDRDAATADAAGRALRWFRADVVARRLEAALGDDLLRERAACALADLVGDPALAPLLAGLTRPSPRERQGLRVVDDQSRVADAILAALSHDRDPTIRRLAVDRLVEVDEPSAVRALRDALDDPSDAVRRAAADALARRRRRGPSA